MNVERKLAQRTFRSLRRRIEVGSVVADVLRRPLPSWTVAAVALGIGVRLCATAQTAPVPVPASVDASLVLDAAGPEQRRSLLVTKVNSSLTVRCANAQSGAPLRPRWLTCVASKPAARANPRA